MKTFLVGLLVIFLMLVVSGLGMLLVPLIFLLGIFLRWIVGLLFLIAAIWLIGKVTLLVLEWITRKGA